MGISFWLRILAVSAPPVLVLLSLTLPALQPKTQTITGALVRTQACLVICADVARVGDLVLGCRVDLLGAPYACSPRVLAAGPATVQFATFPTLAGLFGQAPVHGTVTRVERDGQVVYARTVAQLVWSALYGGWLFHAVYWPIAALVIWRWPQSRFSRRATWSE